MESKIEHGFTNRDIVKDGINALDSRVTIFLLNGRTDIKKPMWENIEVIDLPENLGWYFYFKE